MCVINLIYMMSQNKIPVQQIRIDHDHDNIEIHQRTVSWDRVYRVDKYVYQ